MNKQLEKNLSVRELTKILFNTLKGENGLAIKMIVRNFNNKKTEEKKHEYTEPRTFCKNIRI
jgi:hypothetical protein